MFGTRHDTPLLHLFRFHLRVADTLATVSFFSFIFGYVTGWEGYAPPRSQRLSLLAWYQGISSFIHDSGPAPVLGLAAIMVYVLGRNFARYSVEIMPLLFTDSRTPTARRIDTPLGVFAKTYGQLLIVVLMVLSCKYLWIFCPLLIALHSYYWWFDTAQVEHLGNFFRNSKYDPEAQHPHREFFLQRRELVLGYLGRYHRVREVGVIVFAAAALTAYFQGFPTQGVDPTLAGYSLVIFGMALNELIVGSWRSVLKRHINQTIDAQTKADIARDM